MAAPDQNDVDRWLATVPGFLQGLTTDSESRPTLLHRYQTRFMLARERFRGVEKARGVGMSWACAAEALARAHIRRNYTAIFVSVNLDEAIEKIRYASLLYETIPSRWRKPKVVDNRTSIEFEAQSGVGRSRLISLPCKEPRGKHDADVYLDEFAHYGSKQRQIYVAATPIVGRESAAAGQLTMLSSVLAVGDLFHDVMRQERRKFPGFFRQSIHWWECASLCNDVETATRTARRMSTEERVMRFALPPLQDVYGTMEREDFCQEYELAYTDEAESYFPYELILGCCEDLVMHPTVDALMQGTTGELFAGYDVGRTKNTSELIVVEKAKSNGHLTMRMDRSFDRTRFQEQETFIRDLMKRCPRLKRLCIDRHGIGMNLAENLHTDFRSRVEGIALIGQEKESLAVDAKIMMENERVTLQRARQLIGQIHSIKRTATDAGYARFDTERADKHHADKFWSLALAIRAAGGTGADKPSRRKRGITVSVV